MTIRTIILNKSSILLVLVLGYSIFISYRYAEERQMFKELANKNQGYMDKNLNLNDEILRLKTELDECKLKQAMDSLNNQSNA